MNFTKTLQNLKQNHLYRQVKNCRQVLCGFLFERLFGVEKSSTGC